MRNFWSENLIAAGRAGTPAGSHVAFDSQRACSEWMGCGRDYIQAHPVTPIRMGISYHFVFSFFCCCQPYSDRIGFRHWGIVVITPESFWFKPWPTFHRFFYGPGVLLPLKIMRTSFTSSKAVGKNIPSANSNPVQIDSHGGKAVFSVFPAFLRSVSLDPLFGACSPSSLEGVEVQFWCCSTSQTLLMRRTLEVLTHGMADRLWTYLIRLQMPPGSVSLMSVNRQHLNLATKYPCNKQWKLCYSVAQIRASSSEPRRPTGLWHTKPFLLRKTRYCSRRKPIS